MNFIEKIDLQATLLDSNRVSTGFSLFEKKSTSNIKSGQKSRTPNDITDKNKTSPLDFSSFLTSPKKSIGLDPLNVSEALEDINNRFIIKKVDPSASYIIDSSGFNQADLYENFLDKNYRGLNNCKLIKFNHYFLIN